MPFHHKKCLLTKNQLPIPLLPVDELEKKKAFQAADTVLTQIFVVNAEHK